MLADTKKRLPYTNLVDYPTCVITLKPTLTKLAVVTRSISYRRYMVGNCVGKGIGDTFGEGIGDGVGDGFGKGIDDNFGKGIGDGVRDTFGDGFGEVA